MGKVRQWLQSSDLEGERTVVAAALLLFVVMAFFKLGLLVWLLRRGVQPLPRSLPFAFMLFGADAVTAGVYALLAAPLSLLPRPLRLGLLIGVHAGLTVLLGVSLRINQLYGQPLNIRMLQYAADGSVMACVKASSDPVLLTAIALGIASGFALTFVSRVLASPSMPARRWTLWGTAAVLVGASVGATALVFHGLEFNLGLKSNTFVHFVRTYRPVPTPADFRAELDEAKQTGALEHEISFDLSSALGGPGISVPEGLAGSAEHLDVLVILLESTPAIELTPTLTPNLAALRDRSVTFTHHFTTAPFTFDAQHALFYSRPIRGSGLSYPDLYQGPPKDTSLLELLQASGRQTAVFQSSYASFLSTTWLFDHKGAGTIENAETLLTGLKPGWAWGAYENDTVDAAVKWVEAHQKQPFALVYNPISPHHPYAWPKKERFVAGDEHEDDYRNALHFTDTQIGRLLSALDRRGLREKTLIVTVADHGESVGRGHGFGFFADELWVPFFFEVPGHAAARVDAVSGHLDVAPTLSGLLSLPHPAEWLGRDFTAGPVEPRVSLIGSVFGERAGLVDGPYGWCEEDGHAPAAYKIGKDQFEPIPETDLPAGAAAHYHATLDDLDRRLRLRNFARALVP